MSSPTPHAAFDHPVFRRFLAARFLSTVGGQMGSVAIGWQVYALTHRPLDLGYVGLAQFLPAMVFSLVTGHVADRYDRRSVAVGCLGLAAVCWLLLAGLTQAGLASTAPIYVASVLLGTARAFAGPANQALLPNLVPKEHFGSAVAWSSTSFQVATIAGPAGGGVLYAAGGARGVYLASALCAVAALVLMAGVKARPAAPTGDAALTVTPRGASWDTLLAGVRYVWREKLVLGAISLDLFAVLLGGAVALLPVFARDLLHAGPWGLGLLRSAPAIGATATAVALAYRPLSRRAGPAMLVCVAIFGLATIAFGLSRHLALSFAALLVVGASDMVSMVVRQHAVQLATPDAMRGRVSAVNLVFVGASNELGEFESGLTAQWLGPVRAVVLGGVGTLLVVALWAWRFPVLRRLDRLDDLKR